MQVQTGIVHRFLSAAEFSVNRNRTRKIRTVVTVFCAEIHQYQFAVFTDSIIGYIVQGSGIIATGNDAAVGRTRGPLAQKTMPDLGFDLVFGNTGTDKLEQTTESNFGDIDRLLYHCNFFFGFDAAQFFHDPGSTLKRMQRVGSFHLIHKPVFAAAYMTGFAVVFVCIEIDMLCQMHPGLQGCINGIEPYNGLNAG